VIEFADVTLSELTSF